MGELREEIEKIMHKRNLFKSEHKALCAKIIASRLSLDEEKIIQILDKQARIEEMPSGLASIAHNHNVRYAKAIAGADVIRIKDK